MEANYLPVSEVRGVGPKKHKYLESIGISSVEDLLYYFPRDYEDRTKWYLISQLPHGKKAGIRAKVAGGAKVKNVRRNFSVIKVPVEDHSGKGWAVWFNNPYAAKSLRKNVTYDFFGKVERKFGEVQIHNPIVREIESYEDEYNGNIVPIYSKSGRLTPKDFERTIRSAIQMVGGQLEDIFPPEVRKEYRLEDINLSIKNIHFPSDCKSLEKARYRLVFEELFLLQLGLLMMKKGYEKKGKGIYYRPTVEEEKFVESLPYRLTDAQQRAWSEIKRDMENDTPMNRLLQGDVGSGKTVIAVLSLVKAVANGYQGALMAPTEILAEQHYATLSGLLSGFGMKTALLVGSCTAKEKQEIYKNIKEGKVDIVIGTHALIQEKLEFCKLGMVVTDEQHRFGVRQRSALFGKGANPDVLVMTATPIPRTLALILYGDMDISLIDQMPPGRKRVETYVVDKKIKERAYGFVVKQLREGRQAYVVCPLIEETDSVDAVSATETYENLVENYFKEFRVALIHGKIHPSEKERIMKDFRDGKIDMLVSTTVIEVGVNVPNANVMVIENAERFGLAQLHQLRGRVGRGDFQSYCILISEGKSKVARERMKIMASTTDGFDISEKDLMLRGPGDFFGTRQHGLPDLKIATLPRDIEILKKAQELAVIVANNVGQAADSKWTKALNKVKLLFEKNNFPIGTI
jgi:ATP-dependent DNA helicase RecG